MDGTMPLGTVYLHEFQSPLNKIKPTEPTGKLLRSETACTVKSEHDAALSVSFRMGLATADGVQSCSQVIPTGKRDIRERPALPSGFKKELADKSDAFFLKRNSKSSPRDGIAELALELSRKWDVPDIQSVYDTLNALALRGLDCISQKNLSPENIWCHRAVKEKHLDTINREITNNPEVLAKVIDHRYHKVYQTEEKYIGFSPFFVALFSELNKTEGNEVGKMIPSLRFEAGIRSDTNSKTGNFLPHGAINVLVSLDRVIENKYCCEGRTNIRINLAEVFNKGGRIHRDTGAMSNNAVVIALPLGKTVPFEFVQ